MDRAPLRVVFLGNDPWSVPALAAIDASTHEIALVVTAAPRPAGRGSKLRPTAVADAAHVAGWPLLETATIRDGGGTQRVREAAPDVLVVVAFGELLTGGLLGLAPRGAVNLHFSLLPALRGAAPVQHALLAGLDETGVTTMRMDEGLDTGPILLQRPIVIGSDEDAGALGLRLAAAGGELLVQTLDAAARDALSPRIQDPTKATWAPKLGPADRAVDWSGAARELVRRVRALSPAPAATTRFRGKGLKVFRAAAIDADAATPDAPGTIVPGADATPLVATGSGSVALLEVGPEGRGRMDGAAFARGARIEAGERLG
ncbi:MAG: methionyl-tRNA formyltransferase [Actinomycetota bacterium]